MSETFNLKDLAPHFLRATEQAAIASSKFRGLNDKNKADDAAVNAMRKVFDNIPVHARVTIGEGEMDEAPMLYINESVGTGKGEEFDIAVDPLEGTNFTAKNFSKPSA